jgi:hypothetical protein
MSGTTFALLGIPPADAGEGNGAGVGLGEGADEGDDVVLVVMPPHADMIPVARTTEIT